jgi:hypothetical protein
MATRLLRHRVSEDWEVLFNVTANDKVADCWVVLRGQKMRVAQKVNIDWLRDHLK